MLFKVLSLFFLGIGVFILMQVAFPVLAYQSWEMFDTSGDQLLADPATNLASVNGFGVTVSSNSAFPAFIVNSGKEASYKDFRLSIPALNLDQIKVLTYSNDFDQSLAQLPGTALPGEKGNVFITGHSALPVGLPKDTPAFFANLPTIKKGDEVILDALGQRYVYKVLGLKAVDPKETSVILPPDEIGRYLSLMTCVPPGVNTKRLIVLAKLES